jgi:hypothetical protein
MGDRIREDRVALVFESVDKSAGLIKGVKLCGRVSRNGRLYPPEVFTSALTKYEGVKCNIDHAAIESDQLQAPSIPFASRFGRFVNARLNPESEPIADLKYNPEHPMAKSFEWWVENDPTAIGFSQMALVKWKSETKDGKSLQLVEAIEDVISVDLVSDPATTNGIFESVQTKEMTMDPKQIGASLTDPNALATFIKDLLAASPVAPADKDAALAAMLSAPADDAPPADESAVPAAIESLAKRGKLGAWGAATIKAHRIATESAKRLADAKKLCIEGGLPEVMATESLCSSLALLQPDAAKLIISEMKKGVGATTTTKRTPSDPPVDNNKDTKTIMSEIWK